MTQYDLIIKNARLVRADEADVKLMDIGIRDGKFSAFAPHLRVEDAREVVDAGGKLAFPGVIDVHQHWGIYNDLREDAVSESRASAQGGVTTGLTYMRTGQYYLNRSGPYADLMPEVLQATEGHSHIDFGFHLAPIEREHIDEIPSIIDDLGVPSFKIFMFYGGHGLHGRSAGQDSFLMLRDGQRYDYAHFEFVMRGIQQAREERPDIADAISLSLHCETAEIMRAYSEIVELRGGARDLAAYSDSRPPHSEGLAITIASYLAHETTLPTINLLHLSSRKAIEAAMMMQSTFPHIDFRREVTIGHLVADISTATGTAGKVNPPLRPREDVEALWEHLLAGHFSWVTSDHACCREEMKFGDPRNDVFAAKSGFGGAEYLLPALVSEGRRRGLPMHKVAELTSTTPAARFGLTTKGQLQVGLDADLALVDDDASWTITAEESASTQEYTPFEGFELTAKVTDTFLRGRTILRGGEIMGVAEGRYLHRPTSR
ncbi:dihydroorotase family protein [Streptomyces canus]|uniref:dihydroorotase n=1 Tax=Streptomyces canus TaxID=58343 RepID=UPI00036E38A8|nr:dihydroorotase family protein [Streptomyces canus]